MKKLLFVTLALAMVLTLAACAAQSTPTMPAGGPPADGMMPAAQAITLVATEAPTTEPTATEAPTAAVETTAAEIAAIEPTATTASVTLTMISAQYCRKSPDINAVGVGHFETGAVITALGRTSDTEFFYIANPDVAGGYCWIWTNYVLINGMGYELPVVESN